MIKTQHAQLNEVRSENEEKREEAPKQTAAAVVEDGDAPDPCSKLKCKDGKPSRH